MPFIRFPDIPPFPGVPPLVRTLASAVLTRTGATFALTKLGFSNSFFAPVWGLFTQSGAAVFEVESVLSFALRNTSKVSDFPIEGGSFVSYNKTGTPFECRMRFVQSKNSDLRQALTTALDAALKSTDLYNIVTPDGVYHNATLEDYDYRRESREGTSSIVVDVMLREVRETAQAQYATGGGSLNSPIPAAKSISPSGASPASFGQVQTLTPSTIQAAVLRGIFGP